ncbi:MAG: hypothetical protein R3257_01645, partial [bacterium]|nr:hypothetical protein [bacterium]
DNFPTSLPPERPSSTPPSSRIPAVLRAKGPSAENISELKHEGWATEAIFNGKEFANAFRFSVDMVLDYKNATDNDAWLRRGMMPPAMAFMGAIPASEAGLKMVKESLPEGVSPSVVPLDHAFSFAKPLRPENYYSVIIKQEVQNQGNARKVLQKIGIYEGLDQGQAMRMVAKGESEYLVGDSKPSHRSRPINEGEDKYHPKEPLFEVKVDEAMVDWAVQAYGETNGAFTSHEAARALGFGEGRVLPHSVMFNFADLAYQKFTRTLGMNQAFSMDIPLPGTGKPGDTLRFYAKRVASKYRIFALNQNDQMVFTAWMNPASPQPLAVKKTSLALTTQNFGRIKDLPIDPAAGVERIDRIRSQFEKADIDALKEVMAPRAEQPIFIAGISDGMGLQLATALLEAGHRNLVGVFYEPEAILLKSVMSPYKKALKAELRRRGREGIQEERTDGDLLKLEKSILDRVVAESDNPAGLKAILARLENVEGLKHLATQRDAHFEASFQNFILARSGHRDGHLSMPENVHETILRAQARNPWAPDLIAVNSIAFGGSRPAPGRPQKTGVPSVDPFTGQVIFMDMAPYHPKSFGETMDAMGTNHRVMLEKLHDFFGPQSLSLFFSWPGGSQYAKGMADIYNGGALGLAKVRGEAAAMTMEIESQNYGYHLGHHKVVSLPSFKSLALSKIPGGYVMGMIAEDVLTEKGVYLDMHQLGPRIFTNALGGETVLENPAAHVDFGYAERTFFPEINRRMEQFQRRVAAEIPKYREAHPEWDGKSLDLETSIRLLRGIVSPEQLKVFVDKSKGG